MELIAKVNFEDDLYMEFSSSPEPQAIGRANNTMSLYKEQDEGQIIWEYYMLDDESDSDELVIGLWFDGNKVTDYDGVFSLPAQALQLLVDSGFNVEDVE